MKRIIEDYEILKSVTITKLNELVKAKVHLKQGWEPHGSIVQVQIGTGDGIIKAGINFSQSMVQVKYE